MLSKLFRVLAPVTMLELRYPDKWDEGELYDAYTAPPSGEDLSRGADNWSMDAAYEAYNAPPSGFDASRFPDRSGGANDLY